MAAVVNLPRLRVFLLTVLDLMGYCDPPFWPKWDYDPKKDDRLLWMISGRVQDAPPTA